MCIQLDVADGAPETTEAVSPKFTIGSCGITAGSAGTPPVSIEVDGECIVESVSVSQETSLIIH